MATAGVYDPNYMMNRRAMLDSIANSIQPGRPNFAGTGTQQALVSSLTGAAPTASADPGFGQQQSAMDRFFQLKQQEALAAVAKRADQLSAARGMHIDGGQSVQMEQELSNDALGQLNAQQASANADLLAQQRAYALQQQQYAEQKRQFDAQQRAAMQQQQYENQMRDKLYRDMRNTGTAAPQQAQGQAANPFATTNPFATGQSGTGSVIGGPATGSSWDTRPGSERGIWGAVKTPGRAGVDYGTETTQQAADRAAANPRSSTYAGGAAPSGGGVSQSDLQNAGFDFTGANNNGGFRVSGVSPAGNPSTSSLTSKFASNYIRR